MKRPDLRIRVQLTVSVCLFTLVCLVSLAVAIYTLSRSTLLGLEKGNLDLNCRMLREETRQEFEDMYQSFSRLSYSNPVQRIYENNTDPRSLLDAANLLHDSFGPDRILLMTLYMANGTEIMEVDSRAMKNRTNIPNDLLPLSNGGKNFTGIMAQMKSQVGVFTGPIKAAQPVMGTQYLLSLTLPIYNLTQGPRSDSDNATVERLGFATFLITCLKIEHILSSVAISSASNEVSAAALCSANSNYTEFRQLIPFYDPSTDVQRNSSYEALLVSLKGRVKPKNVFAKKLSAHSKLASDGEFPVPENMAMSLRDSKQPSAQVNKGPDKSMIASSQFSILGSEYHVVLLQPRKSVFSMPHHLRNAIVISSCAIGGGMIIFTFLFVSFGARQILRLKMAATYEQQAPSKWMFLPLPWWLRPANRKEESNGSDKSEFRVPEKVPLRKHVRDELDDITERFNIMSNELRKQYTILEDRVRVRKKEIEQAKEAADLANAAKSHFLARVTHELRTPLNGIIGTATLCLEEEDIHEIHDSLRTIFKCGELLLHLMTDLLSFSQSEVENKKLEMREFSLKEITSQLTAIFSEQCANKKIKLIVDSDPEDNKFVFTGDTNRILQVIFNLMSNGIKFTPEGGQVHFNAVVDANAENPQNKKLTFYVQDNGPGIVPEMQAKVFEEFVQGDISTHAKKAGVGLGLSICRQLAERMDGSISLDSEVGRGSTFVFNVPLKFRVLDGDSTGESLTDSLDVSSVASIFRNGRSAYGSPLGTPLEKQNQLLEGGVDGANPDDLDAAFDDKGSEPGKPSRSMLTRTLLSTSQRTKELLSSRRRTQSSFGPREFLKRRFSSDTVGAQQEPKPPSEPSSPKSHKSPSQANQSSDALSVPDSKNGKSAVLTPSQASRSPLSIQSGSPKNDGSPKQNGSPRNGQKPRNAEDRENHGSSPLEKSGRGHSTDPSSEPANAGANANEGLVPKGSDNGSEGVSSAPAAANEPVFAAKSVRPPMASGKSFNDQPLPDIRVLVVDDNSVNQEVMMRMLNLEGLKSIKVANDGLDAIEKIKQADIDDESFDVIFMDVQMPNMDGRQATRKIRTEMHKTVPIVAVSAFANEKNADDCIEAGMNLFLSKPLRRPHLREILRSLASFTYSPEAKEGQ